MSDTVEFKAKAKHTHEDASSEYLDTADVRSRDWRHEEDGGEGADVEEDEGVQIAPFDGQAPTKEHLAAAVYASFQTRFRERLSIDEVAAVLEGLDLREYLSEQKAPQLLVRRLRFTGTKHFHDQDQPIPIDYEQSFAHGVNVILIEANEVGKSSIWKTIKFALTGDDGDYDADVRSWITNIWLTFTLADQPYTVILARQDETVHAILVPGEESRALDVARAATSVIFEETGAEAIKAQLQHFFFNRLGLTQLAWTQDVSANQGGGVTERKASWLTYFQALLIPDGGERYLLCDPEHNYGNQSGLILSAFLGLSLAEPLNKLGVEASHTRKSVQQEKQLSTEEIRKAEEQISVLETELATVRERRTAIAAEQRARRQAVENADSNRRVLEMQTAFEEKRAEYAQLEAAREDLNKRIQMDRGRERQLREAVALQLHFTGIAVTLCPNCDTAVDETAVAREYETHACRLCGKPAHAAPADELAAMKSEADACEARRQDAERDRDAIRRRMTQLHDELERLTEEITRTQRAAAQGVAYAFPTAEEETEQEQLLTRIGTLQRDLTLAMERLQGHQPEIDRLELHRRVVEKVRDALKQEAARRNAAKLNRLAQLTQDIVRRIGAESVTDVTCSSLGIVQLHKHGQPVTFTSIKNDGERLRVKLAFFLAMMRLSRELDGGRHPGLLIIDQPGSSEMVDADFGALASIFRQVNEEFGTDVQVICCTARPQFAAATESDKVYGAQAGAFAF